MRKMHFAVGPSIGHSAIEHHGAQKACLVLIAGMLKRTRMDTGIQLVDLCADGIGRRDAGKQIGSRSVEIKDRYGCSGIRGLIIDTDSILECVETHVSRMRDVGPSD